MPRTLSAEFEAALAASVVRPVFLFEGEFANGTTNAWTGIGTLSWDGKEWLGVGHLAGASPIVETGDPVAHGIAVSLSGIPSARIAQALAQSRQGRPGRIWLGLLVENSDSPPTGALELVVDPDLSFDGRLDVPEIEEGGEAAIIRISYESRLVDLERPRERRYTPEDQKIDYPDDLGFDFVPELQEWNGFWGR
jgi:hypothetical protein